MYNSCKYKATRKKLQQLNLKVSSYYCLPESKVYGSWDYTAVQSHKAVTQLLPYGFAVQHVGWYCEQSSVVCKTAEDPLQELARCQNQAKYGKARQVFTPGVSLWSARSGWRRPPTRCHGNSLSNSLSNETDS